MLLVTPDPKNFFLAFLLFLGGCFSFNPGEPVAISPPSSVESSIQYSYPAFLIEIRKDETIWYSVVTSEKESAAIKIDEPVRKNLAKAIADYKKQNAGEKSNYLIKGDPDPQYPPFEKVIDALKDNEEYKYNLVMVPTEQNRDE